MRKLFVSFTGTLFALNSGKATMADLATGLFYFGCVREHAINPNEEKGGCDERLWVDRDDPEVGKRVHAQLVEALLKAETEGRVAWRGTNGNRYGELNKLLTASGLPELQLPRDSYYNYSYPGVQELVEAQCSEALQVVWRS